MTRPNYCLCADDAPDPCQACGATVAGDDSVRGVCQARHNRRKPEPLLVWALRDRRTGKIVSGQAVVLWK